MTNRKFKTAWYMFFGHILNMQRQEILTATIGEMSDLISCLSVYNGGAKEKQELSIWELIE